MSMNLSAFTILVVLSIVLAILGLVKPTWPLVAVGLLLLAIAVLIGKS
jgi:hypothetical protein